MIYFITFLLVHNCNFNTAGKQEISVYFIDAKEQWAWLIRIRSEYKHCSINDEELFKNTFYIAWRHWNNEMFINIMLSYGSQDGRV